MIEIICYRLGLFFTTHQTIVYAGQTEKGNKSVSFSKKSGQNFVTVKVNHNEIYVKPV